MRPDFAPHFLTIIEHIHMAAIFLKHQARGGRLKSWDDVILLCSSSAHTQGIKLWAPIVISSLPDERMMDN